MASRNDDTTTDGAAEVPMTVRFTQDVKEALRLASFTHRISQNDLVREGTVMRLAALDDTLARALADADDRMTFTWEAMNSGIREFYRDMARKVTVLLTGAEQR